MSSPISVPAESPPAAASEPAKLRSGARQIRGSSLLVAGRVLAKGINFGVHVLIVRYLAKSDYGAFAYAMSIVSLGEYVADFGLHRAINRFVPIYHEQRDYAKVFGTIFLTIATIVSLGLASALLVYLVQDTLAAKLIDDRQALSLLLILIFLAPVEALDRMLIGLFAVFGSARSIFFRRYVVGPGIKLVIATLLISGGFNVHFLAGGSLVAGVLCIGAYGVVLLRVLAREGLLAQFDARKIEIPWKEVLLFTTPLLTTDLVHVLMSVMDVVFLGYYGDTTDVAAFRAVQPAARLNQIVFATFGLLFTPQAARLFARDDRAGLNHLYWQTASWIAVMTFPVFILTFSLARPLTLFLYGARYEQSGTVLALLSLGYYFHAALGFNGTTLTIYRKIRYVVILNLVVAAFNIAAYLILIPRFGALGAATGTMLTLVFHNILKQGGLLLGTGINVFEWRYLRVYFMIATCAVLLFVVQFVAQVPFPVYAGLAAVAFLFVLRRCRDLLDIENTFPELMRFPLVARLLGK